MTITIGLWIIPAALTIALWVAVSLRPVENQGGDYSVGPALDSMLSLVMGVVGTLVIWLVYFIALTML